MFSAFTRKPRPRPHSPSETSTVTTASSSTAATSPSPNTDLVPASSALAVAPINSVAAELDAIMERAVTHNTQFFGTPSKAVATAVAGIASAASLAAEATAMATGADTCDQSIGASAIAGGTLLASSGSQVASLVSRILSHNAAQAYLIEVMLPYIRSVTYTEAGEEKKLSFTTVQDILDKMETAGNVILILNTDMVDPNIALKTQSLFSARTATTAASAFLAPALYAGGAAASASGLNVTGLPNAIMLVATNVALVASKGVDVIWEQYSGVIESTLKGWGKAFHVMANDGALHELKVTKLKPLCDLLPQGDAKKLCDLVEQSVEQKFADIELGGARPVPRIPNSRPAIQG